jgi:adenine-specific DNA-methyltransferase
LTWIGKGQEPAVEPRILLHDASRDYGDPDAANMLIHGDNLLALKALEQEFAGRVKCVYIDPPFNTGARIDADGNEIGYDDGVEHSIWLQLMAERIKLIYRLLRNDGALFIHLDDNEVDYCRVLTDEIFGRKNFMNRITIDSRSPSAFSTVNPGVFKAAEYLLFYAKDRASLVENPIRTERTPDYAYDKFITNIDADYSQWQFISVSDAYTQSENTAFRNAKQFLNSYHKFIIDNADRIFRFTAISDTGAGQATVALKYESLEKHDTILRLERDTLDDVYVLNGQQISFYSKNVTAIDGKKSPSSILTDIWTDIAWEGIATEGGVKFKKGKKPERLLKRCIELVTSPGDLVLDSFLGSGTTAAVAHKMGRKYIGIELGTHCYSHCLPRLQKVVDGEQSGISKIVGWHGGGGFKFYELAPTLIVKDENGFEIISEQYDATMLAAAVAKLCGYRFAPREDNPYVHGVNNVGGFIFVTTQYITAPLLGEIAKNFSDTQSLVICASAFQVGIKNNFPNIKLRKIFQSVLAKCEYGAENYDLNVVELPDFEETEEDFEDAE